MQFTQDEERELPQIISAPRFATYLQATNNNKQLALSLYQWNLEISAAFIVPLQVCEIAARNAVVSAIIQRYGANWHLSRNFEQSLPQFARGYCPHQDFVSTRNKLQRHNILSAGKIVADLKFAFWENMLTSRHDHRLWTPYFISAFPYADTIPTIYTARGRAKIHLEKIRKLRNRIAHHEPIFTRNVREEYDRILDVIAWCSPTSRNWVDKIQTLTAMINDKPIR